MHLCCDALLVFHAAVPLKCTMLLYSVVLECLVSSATSASCKAEQYGAAPVGWCNGHMHANGPGGYCYCYCCMLQDLA